MNQETIIIDLSPQQCTAIAAKFAELIDYSKLGENIAALIPSHNEPQSNIVSAKDVCRILNCSRRTLGNITKEYPEIKQPGKYSRGFYRDKVLSVKAIRER